MTATSRVAEAINEFKQLVGNSSFHMFDLTEFVTGKAMVAPDTPGRILRAMRADGDIRYALIDRASSLYKFL